MAELRLDIREFQDLTRWRWLLTDASGEFIADHEVRLDPADWQFEAFTDLAFYLRWQSAPDRRRLDEERIVGEVGEWIGSRVLGAVGQALAARRAAVVRVVVPAAAEELRSRPLELAHVAGQPLAVQDVTLVMSAGTDTTVSPPSDRLRVLGLFSLPEGKRALNLRRERQELVRLIEGIAATGKAADVRVLQYGVTRDALRDMLADGEGWDIVHVSGHGRPGELLLEEADGSPDPVDGPALADLLDVGCGRVKLVTVSACWSGAAAAREQRRMLGLPAAESDEARADADAVAGAGTVSGTLASLLASRLGCAVLAMRYPVGDSFAMALTSRLYELLADKGQPLARAVGMTLHDLAGDPVAPAGRAPGGPASAPAFPPLSVATPALFGDRAVDLRLAAPSRPAPLDHDARPLKMAGFPPLTPRFVGRTGVMARASAALAARSGIPGVLLHGMPGGGKTACALELAYSHEHAFDHLAWYKAPDDGMAIDGALTDFALTLERYLPGFLMAHELVPQDRLAAFLPELVKLLKHRRVLIVIDNAESLLTEGGAWRDDLWGQVISALTAHAGLGRVLLTSRHVPVAGVAGLRVASVDALSADEALLLIRELPHLCALSQDWVPGIDPAEPRRLVRRAIELAQGHPKLLELAEGQAADPKRLAALLEAGDQAWKKQGGLPDGFFTDIGSAAPDTDYLGVLTEWTTEVASTLAPGAQDLFWFLCCLEEPDRERQVLDGTWASGWQRLGRADEPPRLDQALAAITAAGLAAARQGTGEGGEYYALHPGVAEAGRASAGTPFRDATDIATASYWAAVHRQASGETGGAVHTGRAARAGLAAVPYLLRQQQWADAAALLEQAFPRDPSSANAMAMFPAAQRIARHDLRQAQVLALVLAVRNPAEAEAVLRQRLGTADADKDHRTASVVIGRLLDLLRNRERLTDSLALADQKIARTRQADLGPWTQLADQCERLQVQANMGEANYALSEANRLRDLADSLPVPPGADEIVTPWNVRELILETSRQAARRLGQWEDAIGLNAASIASKRDRAAPATEIAWTQYNDYFPLLELGQTDDALVMLLGCLQAFLDARDNRNTARVFSALADTEDRRGHSGKAASFERDALRYHYLSGDVIAIGGGYHNLGGYLVGQTVPAFACHLTAALIMALASHGFTDTAIYNCATDVIDLRSTPNPLASVADLVGQLDDIPGTDLARIIRRLSPDPEPAEQVLRDLIAKAKELAAARSSGKRTAAE